MQECIEYLYAARIALCGIAILSFLNTMFNCMLVYRTAPIFGLSALVFGSINVALSFMGMYVIDLCMAVLEMAQFPYSKILMW